MEYDLEAAQAALENAQLLKALRTHKVAHTYTKDGLVKGDQPGHPFHGNQHSGGDGGGSSYAASKAFAEDRSKRAADQEKSASKSGKRDSLMRASELHGHAASAHEQARRDAPSKEAAAHHALRAEEHRWIANDLRNRAVR